MNNTLKSANLPLFRTVVKVENCNTKILPEANLMFIGSCFTQNIGDKCTNNCISTSVNPFGIVYNPISIASQIERILDGHPYGIDDILHNSGLFHTFDHHSSFSDQNKEKCLNKINNSLALNTDFLSKCEFLFITLGTAYAFYYNETGKLVANCHKYPNKKFQNKLLTVEEIVTSYLKTLERLFVAKPSLQVVFSVSPIRHQRNGFRNNNLSKATLLLAIQQIQQNFPQVHYFEAYELIMDELRDYRFFAEDMIHLNDVAIDFVWRKFVNTFFADATFSMIEKYERLIADFNHRPFNPSGPEYKTFLKTLNQRLKIFKTEYPLLNISDLNSALEQRLNQTFSEFL